MASSTASAAAILVAISPLGLFSITEKLTRNNYNMWKIQVLSGLKGAQMFHFIDPAVKSPEKFITPKSEKKLDGELKPAEEVAPILNPEFEILVAKDQQA
jgi:hypothetical protein